MALLNNIVGSRANTMAFNKHIDFVNPSHTPRENNRRAKSQSYGIFICILRYKTFEIVSWNSHYRLNKRSPKMKLWGHTRCFDCNMSMPVQSPVENRCRCHEQHRRNKWNCCFHVIATTHKGAWAFPGLECLGRKGGPPGPLEPRCGWLRRPKNHIFH